MNILRIFVVIVAGGACATSVHATGFGCGMTPHPPGYHCNYADALWAGYQPTQPVYVPHYGCGFGGLGWHHFGSACGGDCYGGAGWRPGGFLGRLRASGDGLAGCSTSFPHTGLDVSAGCTGPNCGAPSAGHKLHPAGEGPGPAGAAPAESLPTETSPSDAAEGELVPEPPSDLQDTSATRSPGPFEATAEPDDEPALLDDSSELLPPSGNSF